MDLLFGKYGGLSASLAVHEVDVFLLSVLQIIVCLCVFRARTVPTFVMAGKSERIAVTFEHWWDRGSDLYIR